MPDYIGAACGNLAWLAWRKGNLSEARNLGQQALEAWQQTSLAYASQWTALWPLIGVALAESQPGLVEVAEYARRLLDSKQQRLPVNLQAALEAAVQAAGAANGNGDSCSTSGKADERRATGGLSEPRLPAV